MEKDEGLVNRPAVFRYEGVCRVETRANGDESPTNYNRPPSRRVRHLLHISPPEGFLQERKDLTLAG